jgi:hypothetical protein
VWRHAPRCIITHCCRRKSILTQMTSQPQRRRRKRRRRKMRRKVLRCACLYACICICMHVYATVCTMHLYAIVFNCVH